MRVGKKVVHSNYFLKFSIMNIHLSTFHISRKKLFSNLNKSSKYVKNLQIKLLKTKIFHLIIFFKDSSH